MFQARGDWSWMQLRETRKSATASHLRRLSSIIAHAASPRTTRCFWGAELNDDGGFTTAISFNSMRKMGRRNHAIVPTGRSSFVPKGTSLSRPFGNKGIEGNMRRRREEGLCPSLMLFSKANAPPLKGGGVSPLVCVFSLCLQNCVFYIQVCKKLLSNCVKNTFQLCKNKHPTV